MTTLTTAAFGAVLLTAIASSSQAQGATAIAIASPSQVVAWQTIKGIAQANNMVGGIAGGGQPWSTREGGFVLADLTSGELQFAVVGLVRAGGDAIGTPGAVNQIKGTLVCGPGSSSPKVIDTPLVSLDAQGNANFVGSFASSTAGCSPTDVAFLVRTPDGAWIGNGSVRALP